MNSRRLQLFAIFLGLILSSGFAFEVDSVSLHLHILEIQRARAPEIYENSVIFSYPGPARFVGAVFAHEGYETIHPFEKNKNGVFVYVFPLTPAPRILDSAKSRDKWTIPASLDYRLVVDGVWTHDSMNPYKKRDIDANFLFSSFPLPELNDEKPGIYKLVASDGRTVHFRYKARPDELITVCGDFNDWDPFMYELEEIHPGTYEITLYLSAGTYRYVFVHNGEKLLDPLNPETNYTKEGNIVSVLKIAPL